jgi:hypothetical protein
LKAQRVASLLAVSTALVLAGFRAAPALAQNWLGFTASGDPVVSFDQCNLTTTVHDAFHDNNSHDIEPTDIDSQLVHSCTTIDVGVFDNSYPQPGPGFYECHDFNDAGTVCLIGHVHMDTDDPGIPEDSGFTLEVLCQEVGHSVGLDHAFNAVEPTCMIGTSQHLRVPGHDQGHINANY